MKETPFCLTCGHILPYSMSDSNTTDFTNPSTFILLGIPGLEAAHIWISIPFCVIYALAILGNFTILFIVKIEPSLHEPMYYFLCMLAVTDLGLSTFILPKMLSIFWLNSREIDFSACLTQMYFIHCFSVMESGIFVAMALDRYVAICHPLRHSTILTNSVVSKIGLAVVLRGSVLVLPFPFLARRWPYCRTTIISHSYCEHMAVVKLACADIRVSSYYSLSVAFCLISLDFFLSLCPISRSSGPSSASPEGMPGSRILGPAAPTSVSFWLFTSPLSSPSSHTGLARMCPCISTFLLPTPTCSCPQCYTPSSMG
ncbi:unnamed protein product [Eretmochelys imbricata]